MENRIKTDVLVVGGGMAGWMAASKAIQAGAKVALADKGYVGKAGQSPYASAFFSYDEKCGKTVSQIVDEIHKCGEYLSNREWSEITIRRSREMMEELKSWGVEFGGSGGPGGPGGSENSLTGSGKRFHTFKETFGYQARKHLLSIGIQMFDRVMITNLMKQDGRVCGAIGISADSDGVYIFQAKSVILCTGGCGMKAPGYPMLAVSTGDGERMAYEVGAELLGKEFVQPMRTTAENPSILGGRSLKPGHWLSGGRAIRSVVDSRFWKMGNGESFKRQDKGRISDYNFSYLEQELTFHAGEGPITVEGENGETYHVVSGGALGMAVRKADGIWPADMQCRSNVPGLFAAGDTLGTMQNGALYLLMGASIEGCAVSGAIAGENAAKEIKEIADTEIRDRVIREAIDKAQAPRTRKNGYSARWIIQLLQNTLMPYYVAFIKKEDRLKAALTNILFIREHLIPMVTAADPHELRLAHEADSMALATEIRLRSALFRTESRGMHYREDYPYRDDINWLCWTKVVPSDDGMKIEKVPIPEDWRPVDDLSYSERYPFVFPGEEKMGVR